MLQTVVIGHLGADAEVKSANGREFVSFRVAHSESWTDEAGHKREETMWVDCIINGRPAVLPYLKKGQQIYASGNTRTRVYSSKKDRCMKAGLTINVRNIELLGGKVDDVPTLLYMPDTGEEIRVQKFFHAQQTVRGNKAPELLDLFNRSGEVFQADRKGWVSRKTTEE